MQHDNISNILNNRNKTQDYDKNPLIIKDYGISVNLFSIIFFVSISLIGLFFWINKA